MSFKGLFNKNELMSFMQRVSHPIVNLNSEDLIRQFLDPNKEFIERTSLYYANRDNEIGPSLGFKYN